MLCAQKNFIETSLELHLNFIESILKLTVGGLCKVLVRFVRSSNEANSLRSTRLNPLDCWRKYRAGLSKWKT